MTNRPVFLSTIENSNFKPTFLLVFLIPPLRLLPFLKAQRESPRSAQTFSSLSKFTAFAQLLFTHISLLFQFLNKKLGECATAQWTMTTDGHSFPPQNFLYVDAKKEIQPSCIYSPSKFTQVLFMCRI